MRKSNYIAAAMAFAALVGCQKELVPVSSSEQADSADLAQRPVLANTTLTIGGAETRVALTEGGYSWEWEAKDMVGAVLTDQIVTGKVTLYVENEDGEYISAEWSYEDYLKGTKVYSDGNTYAFADALTAVGEEEYVPATSQVFYKITDKQVWTNYRYERKGKDFTTEARLVEGHYMFYAPYNAGNGTRGPLVATLPVIQKATYATEAVKKFYNGETPAILSLEYLSADGTTSVQSNLEHIYAYPEFTIYNNFDGYLFDGGTNNSNQFVSTAKSKYTMTLKQIEFYTKSTDNLLAYKRAIKPSELIKAENWHADFLLKDEVMSYTQSISTVNEEFDPKFSDRDDETNWVKFEKSASGLSLRNSEWKKEQRIVVDLGGKELKNGEKYSFHAILPAENYTDGGLYARILVTIAGRDYYIITKQISNNKFDSTKKFGFVSVANNKATVTAAELNNGTDYQFADRHQRGSNDIVLVRGQRYPAAEVAVDPVTREKSVKTFVKDNKYKSELLMIELVGGDSQVAVAAATPETKTFDGIENNKQLIDSILANVFTSGVVEEVHYGTDTKGDHSKFYFNIEKNETIINAELIQAMQTHLGRVGATFKLTETNLPIAADVLVEDKGDGVYTFTAGEYSYDIIYEGVNVTPTASNKLFAGINIVNGGELKMDKNQTNAVVFVNGNATVKTPAGINGIVMNHGTLTVNSTADVAAWIKAADVVLVKGNLVNALNVLGTVENNNLQTIKGETNLVTYVTKAGFDTNVIATATQVNYVTVFSSKSGTILPVTPTSFDFIKNLKNVTVMFDSNVAGLVSGNESTKGITLTNIKQMMAPEAITWGTTDDFYGIVNVYCDENADLEKPFYVNIKPADKSVKFNAPEGMEEEDLVGSQAFNAAQLQNQLDGGNAKLGSDITTTSAIDLKGGELDGNGYTLNSSSHYGVEASAGGTIMNLTIDAKSDNDYSSTNTGGYSSRAVYANPLSTDLTIDNCILKGGYSLNISGTNTYKVTVVKSQLYGWCSWAAEATFTGCDFLMGNYFTAENQKGGEGALDYLNGGCAPWKATTFENCNFPADWYFDMSKLPNGVKVTFINCTIGGKKLTGPANFNGWNGADMLIKEGHFEKPSWSENIGGVVDIK